MMQAPNPLGKIIKTQHVNCSKLKVSSYQNPDQIETVNPTNANT